MSDPMLHADPGTPSVPRTLSDFGGATNDSRVFSESPVGSGSPAPAANGDSDDEVTIRQTSLTAPANPHIVIHCCTSIYITNILLSIIIIIVIVN